MKAKRLANLKRVNFAIVFLANAQMFFSDFLMLMLTNLWKTFTTYTFSKKYKLSTNKINIRINYIRFILMRFFFDNVTGQCYLITSRKNRTFG